MIDFENSVFYLSTQDTSYIFRITKFGHLESIFYGDKIKIQDVSPLTLKQTATIGTSVSYDKSDDLYCLDNMTLEYSGIGKGDFRHSPMEIKMPDGSFVCDFTYLSHKIYNNSSCDGKINETNNDDKNFAIDDNSQSDVKNDIDSKNNENQIIDNSTSFDATIDKDIKTNMNNDEQASSLPFAYGSDSDCKTLEITMKDEPSNVYMKMYYTVFYKTNIIARHIILENKNPKPLTIRKIMSMMVDLNIKKPMLLTLDGGWIKEANKHVRPLQYGLYVNESTTGASSNRHNPGIIIYEDGTHENYGNAYGFNLIYSGNHYEGVELSNHGLLRVMTGINPFCFEWELKENEIFKTPQAVMTFSSKGFNGVSRNFHDFVNDHIVRGDFKGKDRPVLVNNWEAHFFKFNQRKLLHMAKQSKTLGVELFVVDDGWFGKRDSDKAGLGDYNINKKKFPGGLLPFVKKIKKMGLGFGLWFEPEMVNEDSDLYRSHPEYAVKLSDRTPSYGRNQLVLDLCNPKVCDYIVSNISDILDSYPISYVKWDMNRHMTDMFSLTLGFNQGRFFHEYILGLYSILTRIFAQRPHILLETCSSGGNRFDLGMLCFSPQIWASDDTDPIERLKIQAGLSYFYPLSAIAAHVSNAPHQQTLRNTTLSTRFNVASFGSLGYEMDLKYLKSAEIKEIREQISFYKKNRSIFLYGKFYRFDSGKDNKVQMLCVDKNATNAIAGNFQTLSTASESSDILPLRDLDSNSKYSLETFNQGLSIKRFGALMNHVLPFKINPDGLFVRIVDRFYRMKNCEEKYTAFGDLLNKGIRLNNQFMGTWYNDKTRLLGDFGSTLYVIKKTDKSI